MKQTLGPELLLFFSSEKTTSPSKLQGEVAREIKAAMPDREVSEGFRDPTSGYAIDILVRQSGLEGDVRGTDEGWAVEVDEPDDFLQVCRVLPEPLQCNPTKIATHVLYPYYQERLWLPLFENCLILAL